jgi:hypothetical protein
VPKFDVVETLPDESLILPIKGGDGKVREYTVQPASAAWFYRFAALKQSIEDVSSERSPSAEDEAAVDVLNTLGSAGLQSVALGPDVVKAMLADGVSSADFRRAVSTALVWHATGGDDDVAARAWSGKAPTAETEPTPKPSTSTPTGGARKTRPRASTKATTSRQP